MNKNFSLRAFVLSMVSVVLLIIPDALSKSLAVKYLKGSDDIILIPRVLQLHYLENTGAAFGILKGHMWLLYASTAAIAVALLAFLLTLSSEKKDMALRIVFVFLLAGAFGNLYDRIHLHYVVDFIYFSLIDFPVFNVADIYVTCSVFVLLFLLLFVYREDREK